jgi:beta-lactam-binding protein with PASTA domain
MTMIDHRPPDAERASAVGPPEIIDRARPRWRLAVGVGIVLALFGLALWAQIDNFESSANLNSLPRIALPSVTGLDQSVARKKLEDLSFVVDVKLQPNEDASKPKGMTFGQDPAPGTKVEQGDVVTLVVSSGPAGLTVPDVVGQQLGDAQELLAANGLRYTANQVHDDTVPPGEVISVDPDPGTQIAVNGQVTLTVSMGAAPRTVPEMMGQDITKALVALGRSGLGVGTITRVYRAGQNPGVVIGVDPPAGSQRARNWPIDLTVTGPPPSSTVPTLVGLSQSTAESLVTDADLVPQVLTTTFPTGDPQIGRVVSQNIPPFGSVPSGTTVQFVVGVDAAGSSTTTTVAGN